MHRLKSFVIQYVLHATFVFGMIGSVMWLLALENSIWWWAAPILVAYWVIYDIMEPAMLAKFIRAHRLISCLSDGTALTLSGKPDR